MDGKELEDLEITGGDSELKWKVKSLHKGQSCRLLSPGGSKY